MTYIIQKRKGIYQIFSDNRTHIGQTMKYSEIRHMIDEHDNKQKIIKQKERRKSLNWYYNFCDTRNIRIL